MSSLLARLKPPTVAQSDSYVSGGEMQQTCIVGMFTVKGNDVDTKPSQGISDNPTWYPCFGQFCRHSAEID